MSCFVSELPGFLAAVMLVAQSPVCNCSETGHRIADLVRLESRPYCVAWSCPCPEPCWCTPQNAQTAILVHAVVWDSRSRQWLHGPGGTWELVRTLLTSREGLGHHAGSAGFLINAGLFAQGNPCALLARWLF